MADDRRLIEHSLPLEAVSMHSAHEKSIRHGHIGALHTWWALRPLSVLRAVVFASLVQAPDSEEECHALHDLIADITSWESTQSKPRIDEAKKEIRKFFGNEQPKVLDPFMGSGSTGLVLQPQLNESADLTLAIMAGLGARLVTSPPHGPGENMLSGLEDFPNQVV